MRAVYAASTRLVDRARRGEGPALLLCNTYRYRGHHVGDINREYYRSKQEEQQWKIQRDPMKILGDWLTAGTVGRWRRLADIESDVRAEMEEAVEFAIAAPYPDVEQVSEDVDA